VRAAGVDFLFDAYAAGLAQTVGMGSRLLLTPFTDPFERRRKACASSMVADERMTAKILAGSAWL
jgi:hypothetical protein